MSISKSSVFIPLFFVSLLTLLSWHSAQAQELPLTPYSLDSLDTPTIIGGTQANPEEWPWMVALVKPGTANDFWAQFCAGALIAPDWVITAAHCAYKSNEPVGPEQIQVLVASGTLGSNANERIGLRQIVHHADYTRSRRDSDIALLQLERPVNRPTIGLVGRNDFAAELTNRTATVLGWGRTEKVFRSDALMQVDVPIVAQNTCVDAYANLGYVVTGNMICAGFKEGGKDACTGDSGGPLVVSQLDASGNRFWQIVGIVSWGKGCAKPDAYGVYTRVSHFTTWIQSQTGIDRTNLMTAQPNPSTTIPVPGLSYQRYNFYLPFSTLTPAR